MAPSIAQESPDVEELNRVAELKITKGFEEAQHNTVCAITCTDNMY